MEKVDLDKLTTLLVILREQGVTHFRCDDLELVMGTAPSNEPLAPSAPGTRGLVFEDPDLFGGRMPTGMRPPA